MLKKRQVLTVVSVAAISFLIGTVFNVNLLAIGKDDEDNDDGSPWDKVWTAISELQSEMNGVNDTLTSEIMNLEGQISDLQTDIEALQTQKDSLNASILELQDRVETLESVSGFPAPDYDRGWTDFGLSQWGVINHGLNTTRLLWYGLREPGNYGTITLMRIIDANSMEFKRTFQWNFHKVRILLWKIPEPSA